LAFIGVAVVAWWGKALLHIPPHFTWPFSKLLAFPHASNYLEVGAVTVLPWVAMCDRFSNLLARVVFPERVSCWHRKGVGCDCAGSSFYEGRDMRAAPGCLPLPCASSSL
jgi:hypothetical protein